MTISKLKIFGTTALACVFALGGLQTVGQFRGLVGSQGPTRAVAAADDKLAPLARSVDMLQSELDETARSTAKMRKAPHEIRAEIKAMSVMPSPPAAGNEGINQADKRRCLFVGEEPMKRMIFSVQRGEPGRVKRLEPQWYNDKLGGLSFSPDGRYLLFCGNRPEPR